MTAAAPLLRVRPVPVVEPLGISSGPAGQEGAGRSAPGPGQGVLPLSAGPPGTAGVPGVSGSPEGGVDAPGAQAWARHFTQAALEVVAGLRQPAQLVRWTSEEVQAALRRRHALARRRGPSPVRGSVRSVHVAHPARGVAEVAAVVADGTRHRAVAFRMEGAAGRWRVTALELG
jgi:hypothetical protein